METLNNLTQVPWLEISIFLVSTSLVLIVFRYTVLNNEDERPVTFKVPVPEQCSPGWTGEILDEPSIKVCRSINLRVYRRTDSGSRRLVRVLYNATVQPMDNFLVS